MNGRHMVWSRNKIVGTREGTVISALSTGFVVKAITKRLRKVGIVHECDRD